MLPENIIVYHPKEIGIEIIPELNEIEIKLEDTFDIDISSTETLICHYVSIGDLSDGYVPYKVPGIDELGDSPICIDGTNVGIGITTPNESLEIYKNTAAQCAAQYGNSNTGHGAGNGFVVGIETPGNALVWQRENSYMKFGTNASERMRILSNGNIGIGTDAPSYKLDLNGIGRFVGNLYGDSNVQHKNFTSGFQGTKWQITSSGDAEFRNVLISGGLQVYELILNQLHYQCGGLIIGAGGGKVKSIDTATIGSEKLYFEDPEGNAIVPFTVGAIVIIQRFDLNRTTVIKKIVRQVATVAGELVGFTTTTGWTIEDDTGIFEAGDEIVAIGHVSNTALDSSIYMSAVDSNNPFLRVFDGVDSYSKWSLGDETAIKLQIGNLESLAEYDIVPASPGYGLYSDNVYLKGKIIISEASGYSNISDKPSSLGDINSSEGTKLTGIETGADVTSTHTAASITGQGDLATLDAVNWNSQIDNIPSTLGTPAGTGLFLSSTYMGFFDSPDWKTYIDSSGNLILGDIAGGNTGLSWNQGTGVLNIKGAINITSASGYTNISDKPSSLGDINSSEGTKLTGIETAATVGANWNTNLSNIPGSLGTPSGTGLFLSSTYMGYYDSGTWKSYIDNQGNCKFVGVVELGTETAEYGSVTSNLAIQGSDIWENAYDGNSSAIIINRIGYDGGTSYYRDFVVYDGKSYKLFQVLGLRKTVQIGHESGSYPCNLQLNGSLINANDLPLELPYIIKKAASANIRNSYDAETSSTSNTYEKVKTITLANGLLGEVRFNFMIKFIDNGGNGTTAYGRIYRNGVALGTEQSTTEIVYDPKSEDIEQNWLPGDTVELWVKTNDFSETDAVYANNFKIAYDDDATIAVASTNS